jgi:hypothetical protein
METKMISMRLGIIRFLPFELHLCTWVAGSINNNGLVSILTARPVPKETGHSEIL